MRHITETASVPKYARGQIVRYADRQGRPQRGRVLNIEAHWPGYSKAGQAPYLIYTVEHPTYRNGRMYASENDLSA